MNKFLMALAVVLCLGSCVTGGSDDDNGTDKYLETGTLAPDFTIYTDDNPDGITLSSFRGKYVVLEFWASWCPDCKAALPAMKSLYEHCASADTVFIGYSFDTDREAWQSYISENGMSWIHYSELKKWKETYINSLYDVRWIPTLYLIDREGRIAYATDDPAEMEKHLLGE